MILENYSYYVTFLKKVILAAYIMHFLLTILYHLSLVHLLQLVILPSWVCLLLLQIKLIASFDHISGKRKDCVDRNICARFSAIFIL